MSTGIGLILICCLFWATDTVFRLPLLAILSAAQISVFEHFFGTISSFPLALKDASNFSRLGRRGWIAAIYVGVVASGIGTLCFTEAYRYLSPSVVIILLKTQPFVVVLLARVFLKETFPKSFYVLLLLGVVLSAFASGVIDTSSPFEMAQGANLKGVLLACTAAATWGSSSVVSKYLTKTLNPYQLTLVRYGFGFLFLSAVVFFELLTHFTSIWAAVGSIWDGLRGDSIIRLFYIGFVPGTIGTAFYYAGLRRVPASVAAVCELFFPTFAVVINWYFLDEQLTQSQIVAALLLGITILFLQKSLKSKH